LETGALAYANGLSSTIHAPRWREAQSHAYWLPPKRRNCCLRPCRMRTRRLSASWAAWRTRSPISQKAQWRPAVNRDNDSYREQIKEEKTGEIIHSVEEKLSDHFRHGSDKLPKKSAGR
jgi:hypothetical protein